MGNNATSEKANRTPAYSNGRYSGYQNGGGIRNTFIPSNLDHYDDNGLRTELFTQRNQENNDLRRTSNMSGGSTFHIPLPGLYGGEPDEEVEVVEEPELGYTPKLNLNGGQNGGEFSGSESSYSENGSEFNRIRNYIMSQKKQGGGNNANVFSLGIETPSVSVVGGNAMAGGEVEFVNGEYNGIYGGGEEDDEEDNNILEGGDDEDPNHEIEPEEEDSYSEVGEMGGGARKAKKNNKNKKKTKRVAMSESSNDNVFEQATESDYGHVNVIPFYSSDSSHEYSFKHPFNRNRFN